MLNSLRSWSLCSQRQRAIRLRKCENKVIYSIGSLGTYRMNISQIIANINRNWLIVHAKTALLLLQKLCSIHRNQHQPDNNKYQPQLVGTSCLDNSVATSEANYPQSDNIQNPHCSRQPYPHLDIRTFQPQQVDTSHQESSTSREDLDSTSNRQDAKQTPQGLMESNQDRTNKPYLQLDIRTYQTSCNAT